MKQIRYDIGAKSRFLYTKAILSFKGFSF